MSKISQQQQYKEEDMFTKSQYLDTYTKIYAQIKKTMDNTLENALNQADVSDYSSDYGLDEELVFEEHNQVNLYIEGEKKLKVSEDLLNLDDLVDFFDLNTLTSLLGKEELQNLRKLLPQQENEEQQNETMKMLFSGQSFKFGTNPLIEFLQKCKAGSYTTMRQQEQRIQRKMALQSLNKYYEDTLLEVKEKLVPETINRAKTLLKKRKAIKRVEELLSSDSDQSEKSFINLRPDVDFDEVSVGNSTDGSEEDRDNRRKKPQQYSNVGGTGGNYGGIQQINGISNQNGKQNSSMSNGLANGSKNNNTSAARSESNYNLNGSQIANSTRFENNDSNSNIEQMSEQQKSKFQTVIDTPQPYYKIKKNKVPVSQEWIENYREQERQRYESPTKPWIYLLQDGSKTCVAPVCKKLNISMQSRPRDHLFLKQKRSPYITILSLVRDACARLPNGQGTRYDICELLKESQYINQDLTYDKVSTIVSGALDRLHYLDDPAIKYDQEKKVWFYLHRDREVDDLAWKDDEDRRFSQQLDNVL
ncbi:hypothetical protein ABPG72_007838 [Tetrahymena utriculariae]